MLRLLLRSDPLSKNMFKVYMTDGILDKLSYYHVAAEDINGKVLGELNQETVKELGVKQIGRQLALLKMI